MEEISEFHIRPLTPTEVGIIRLVKSAIKSTAETLPEGFDWTAAESMIRSQEIYGLVYYGLKNSKIAIPEWLKNGFLQRVVYLTKLWKAAEEVLAEFDKSGIEYVSLKGIQTKDLYPNKYMRMMSDVDILIHSEEYDKKIKPIMLRLGWEEGKETNHEYHWSKSDLNIELHKRIIPSYNEDYYKIIGDGWEWIRNHSEFKYSFIHFAKHYRDSGIGISHLVEMEICWEKEDFADLNLTEFNDNIRKTLDFWFEDGESDDKVDLINCEIFHSGVYGIEENKINSRKIKKINQSNGNTVLARVRDILRFIFPSWELWTYRNPILKKIPILLPFLWLWRLVCAPFKGNIERIYSRNSAITNQDSTYEHKLQFVGLKYDF